MKCSLDQFRKRVVRTSLFSPGSLGDAINRLGFVQADPIRCPARAQDLILRHRVRNYRAGDLEQFYPELELEECYLFAYGFLSKELWRNIHPSTEKKLTRAQQKAVELVKQFGPMHPKELELRVGGKRVQNYWGGFSRSAKLMMDDLHDRGALRVVHREKGIRIYEAVEMVEPVLSREKRFQEIIVSTLRVMGATTRKFLLSELAHFGYLAGSAAERRRCLQQLIEVGRVRADFVDTVEYVSLDEETVSNRRMANDVRFLAPFDPIVRDRARFEHLWDWTYRFEAYIPKAKRRLGYYAMPVLWREHIVGWANASVENDRLKVEIGYVNKRPRERAYRESAEKEVVRLAKFLNLGQSEWEAKT